jgi:predicted nucleic acid-binding protein
VIVYAESSAVLSWLLGEPREAAVRKTLAGAERVVSSAVTAVECSRALVRGVLNKQISRSGELAALQLLSMAAARWTVLDMAGPALERARQRFPVEPVRTLDALHLAAAVAFAEVLGPLTMVSLDDRIRANARALGLATAP